MLIEPEAMLGASFQLSFAAVAALVAVYEARTGACGARQRCDLPAAPLEVDRSDWLLGIIGPRCGAGRAACSLRRSARPPRRPRSWPMISTSSAPMC